MSRWLALLAAIVGGAIAAYAVVLSVVAAAAGILWLYVFGDDPWPEWVNGVGGPLIVICGLAFWAVAAVHIYRRLRRA